MYIELLKNSAAVVIIGFLNIYNYLSQLATHLNMNVTSKIHVISDLFLRFNESSVSDEVIPDCDLVIINGNIGHPKRSMLYVETVCKKYPDTEFIYVLGETELRMSITKSVDEVEQSLKIRRDNSQSWPKNLHYLDSPKLIPLKNQTTIDVLTVYGFPKIHSIEGEWKDTRWARYYVADYYHFLDKDPTGKWFKPLGTSSVDHGHIPIFSTIEWVNQQHELEQEKIANWLKDRTHKKLLISHVNPYMDGRFTGQTQSSYDLDLTGVTWVTANTPCDINFLNARLFANPGRMNDKLEDELII